jgi:hypothetical protein
VSIRLLLLLPVTHIDATDNMANQKTKTKKWRRKEQQPNLVAGMGVVLLGLSGCVDNNNRAIV